MQPDDLRFNLFVIRKNQKMYLLVLQRCNDKAFKYNSALRIINDVIILD